MAETPMAEAVVDLDAYRANLGVLAARAPGSALMAVVKADAYGHGAVECARAAREAGAAWLGVATLDEARALRDAGDSGPLLAWLATPGADFAGAVGADVEVTASSADQLAEVVDGAGRAGRRARVQLKVDTGLSRNGAFGAEWARLVDAAVAARDAGSVDVTGVWSHLACADEPGHPANAAQEQVFADALATASDAGLDVPLRHLSNSAATLTLPSAHHDLVRVGIASYGISPSPELGTAESLGLRPVMTLRAALASVKRVPAGTAVSYGHTWVAPRETTLGLVPVGYGDGLLRGASGRAHVATAAGLRPVVGRICMDQLVVDLGDDDASRGDDVVLFGDAPGAPSAEDWAEAAATIGYEVVTRLGGRIHRSYRAI
ncbi:alanine racemase [Solicola sp. PLA-1-18]|uniref:alanine racemase n=1 Tax=Solicola sp. PLA-1-18 TaxID=3380532 RepID=UPI003B7F320D